MFQIQSLPTFPILSNFHKANFWVTTYEAAAEVKTKWQENWRLHGHWWKISSFSFSGPLWQLTPFLRWQKIMYILFKIFTHKMLVELLTITALLQWKITSSDECYYKDSPNYWKLCADTRMTFDITLVSLETLPFLPGLLLVRQAAEG